MFDVTMIFLFNATRSILILTAPTISTITVSLVNPSDLATGTTAFTLGRRKLQPGFVEQIPEMMCCQVRSIMHVKQNTSIILNDSTLLRRIMYGISEILELTAQQPVELVVTFQR